LHHLIYQTIKISCWLIFGIMSISLLFDVRFYLTSGSLIQCFTTGAMCILGLYLSRKRYRLATLFSVAMFIQFISAVINAQ
jgi:hypothetical protein